MFGNLRTAAVKCETLSVEEGGGSENMHPPPPTGTGDSERVVWVWSLPGEKQEAVGIATGMVL